MEILLDPNVAYLILLGGILLGFLAIVTPGTGLLEVGAFFCLISAGYAVYRLSFTWWALIILVLSLAPFIYAIQKPRREIYLGLAILLIIIGSLFMFPSIEGKTAINPLLAIVASTLVAGFLWISVRKSIEAASLKPTHDLGGLMGQVGEARTEIHNDGSVQVAGELWSARSDSTIPVGSSIRVVRREGFILVVEKKA